MALRASPGSFTFEERDGIYWVSGQAAKLAASLLGLNYEGDLLGFDHLTASFYFKRLLEKKARVSCRTGNLVRTIGIPSGNEQSVPTSSPSQLSPESLLDGRELARLSENKARNISRLRDNVEQMKSALLGRDPPTLYVYEVGGGWYEVDWELTSLTEEGFRAVVLAAVEIGFDVPCRLVPPKPRRSQKREGVRPLLQIGDPISFGQLGLGI
jgi:hypothetical protein